MSYSSVIWKIPGIVFAGGAFTFWMYQNGPAFFGVDRICSGKAKLKRNSLTDIVVQNYGFNPCGMAACHEMFHVRKDRFDSSKTAAHRYFMVSFEPGRSDANLLHRTVQTTVASDSIDI